MEKILFKKPNKNMETIEVDNLNLETLQELVEGYIEYIVPFENKDIAVLINEEGKILGLEKNIEFGTDYLVGNVVILGIDYCDFRGLTEAEIKEVIAELSRFSL